MGVESKTQIDSRRITDGRRADEPSAIHVNLGCTIEQSPGRPSDRVTQAALRFGIPLHAAPCVVIEPAYVPIRPGHIILFLGPSGSGKTTALAKVERTLPGCCCVGRVRFPEDVAVVDRVDPGASFEDSVAILTGCALSEPRLWIRPYAQLSDGERFRARLARAIGLQSRAAAATALFCDEFCSGLHRRAARAIALNLRKLVDRKHITVIATCCDEEMANDLQPDTLVRLLGKGRCQIEQPHRPRRHPGLVHRVRIEPGGKRDYTVFAEMHYRKSDELGFVDKVFVLRERSGGELLGIVVYAYSPAELSLRNRATGGIFKSNPKRLNHSMRILRRLVIHPDVRGCGLGHYLVRKTLPLVGTEFVECLAALGVHNPVFEKAGMKRIGQCSVPPKLLAAIEELRALDADPIARDFAWQVGRRPRVRKIVSGVVFDWYSATTAGGADRVVRQDPQTLTRIFRGLIASEPVYYLWQRRPRNKPTTLPSPLHPPKPPDATSREIRTSLGNQLTAKENSTFDRTKSRRRSDRKNPQTEPKVGRRGLVRNNRIKARKVRHNPNSSAISNHAK